MNMLSIVYSGCLGKWGTHQSAAWLWKGNQAGTANPTPAQCFETSDWERGRAGGEEEEGEGARGKDKKMEEQHLWPSERNPSTIQIFLGEEKKEQIGRKA